MQNLNDLKELNEQTIDTIFKDTASVVLTGNSSNTLYSNGIAGTSNTTYGGTTNLTWPVTPLYSGYSYYYYPSLPVNGQVLIEKAENGFIVTKDNKKYVAKKAEEIVKYLNEEVK